MKGSGRLPSPLRDYLLILIITQAIGLTLFVLWLKTNPARMLIVVGTSTAALVLAIVWPAALGLVLNLLRKRSQTSDKA